MNGTIANLLKSMEFGEPQTFRNITILQIKSGHSARSDYLPLGEALGGGLLDVTEVSEGGSVPELKVRNRGDRPVLLLDGEELLGAKQNRVLNTTILLKERSETVIPVSCTEHGRWSYSSHAFAESDGYMAHQIRASKVRSVSESLLRRGLHESDQHEVWAQIAALHDKAQVASPTGALHDLYKQRQEALRGALEAFPAAPGQRGLLVLIDGEAAGFDWISRDAAYARVHPKLVKSYVVEALLDDKTAGAANGDAKVKALAFLEQAAKCEVKEFASVGYGTDCRFRGPQMAGSALVHDAEPIHTAFFRLQPAEERPGMANLRARRRGLWTE